MPAFASSNRVALQVGVLVSRVQASLLVASVLFGHVQDGSNIELLQQAFVLSIVVIREGDRLLLLGEWRVVVDGPIKLPDDWITRVFVLHF